MSACLCALMEQLGSHWMDFNEIWYLSIFQKFAKKIQISLKLTRIMGTLHKDLWTFMTVYHWILLRKRNVSGKNYSENQNTHFIFSNFFFFFWKSFCLWNNVEKYGTAGQATDDNMIWHMHFACWITNVTDTHSQYVTLTAFPWQQWLHKHASCYITCILPLLFYLNSTTAPVCPMTWQVP